MKLSLDLKENLTKKQEAAIQNTFKKRNEYIYLEWLYSS
jgi:hypothetical protein